MCEYGFSSGNEFFPILEKTSEQGGVWVLYSKYQGNGYLKTKTHNYADADGVQHSREHSYWTQKGRLFLYELLKQRKILPLMEAKKQCKANQPIKGGEVMARVIHVLLDGTILDSIEGMVIPAGHPAYSIIAKAKKNGEKQHQEASEE